MKLHMLVRLMILVFALAGVSSAQPATPEQSRFLQVQAQPATEYVLTKLSQHKFVFIGEPHWVKEHVQFVRGVVTRLRESRAGAVAMEFFDSSQQEALDRLVNGDTWDERLAMSFARSAAWPYQDYLDVMHEVWKLNRDKEKPPIRLLGLSAGYDWRERLLPQKKSSDEWMAEVLLEYAHSNRGSILVFVGRHHAFTRYYQPEAPFAGRPVNRIMERTGNYVWKAAGQAAFMINLHSPILCIEGDQEYLCLPFEGAVDCAAQGRAVGFDVAGSPFAELRLPRKSIYHAGYPDLRLVDFTDGYIWLAPLASMRGVELIPLDKYAPSEEALTVVKNRNPFSNKKGLDKKELEQLWRQREEWLKDPVTSRGWSKVLGPIEHCGIPVDPPSARH